MLNVDSAVGGPNLSADGIPSLRDLFLSAASDVTDPRTGKSLAVEWLEALPPSRASRACGPRRLRLVRSRSQQNGPFRSSSPR